jgi:hypothetical protein
MHVAACAAAWRQFRADPTPGLRGGGVSDSRLARHLGIALPSESVCRAHTRSGVAAKASLTGEASSPDFHFNPRRVA